MGRGRFSAEEILMRKFFCKINFLRGGGEEFPGKIYMEERFLK
jgi:hypothetical protein